MTQRLAGRCSAASSEPLQCSSVCAAAANERPGVATGRARRDGLPVIPGLAVGWGPSSPREGRTTPGPLLGWCAWAKPPSGRPAAVGRDDGRAAGPAERPAGRASARPTAWDGTGHVRGWMRRKTAEVRRRASRVVAARRPARAGAEAAAAPGPPAGQGAARGGRMPTRVGVGVMKRGRQDAGPTTCRRRAVGCVRRTASGGHRPARWSGPCAGTGEPGRGPRPPQADQRGT